MQTSASISGGGQNLDRCYSAAGFAFLLDGATAVRPVVPSVERYVDSLSRHLRRALELGTHNPSIASLAAVALAEVRDELSLSRLHSPSSTVVACRSYRDTLQLLVLGDSPAVVLFRGGAELVIHDPRLAASTASFRQDYEARLREGSGFDSVHHQILAAMQEYQFQVRNREGGYWIAANDPAALGHSVLLALNKADVAAIVLLSDGAFDVAVANKVDNWWGLAEMSPTLLEDFLSSLHELELNDPCGRRHPRPKVHDDKTIVTYSLG